MNRVYSCSVWKIASDMKWKEVCGRVETKKEEREKWKTEIFSKKKYHSLPSPQGKKHIYHVFYQLKMSASFASYFLL